MFKITVQKTIMFIAHISFFLYLQSLKIWCEKTKILKRVGEEEGEGGEEEGDL
jgi:hypothetical protein